MGWAGRHTWTRRGTYAKRICLPQLHWGDLPIHCLLPSGPRALLPQPHHLACTPPFDSSPHFLLDQILPLFALGLVVGWWNATSTCSTNCHCFHKHFVEQPWFRLVDCFCCPLFPCSPHLCSSPGDFLVVRLAILQHLPCSIFLELLSQAADREC